MGERGVSGRPRALAAIADAVSDLVLPIECAGCGAPGVRWCARCEDLLHAGPVRTRPRVPVGVPVWSLGAFTGPRRSAVIALKERGRRDAAAPLARAVASMLSALREAGELDPPQLAPLALVPAPSRPGAVRRRGGDVVARVAELAADGCERASAARVLRLQGGVRDSVGLGVGERERNMAGAVKLRAGAAPGLAPASSAARPVVVFVDDVVTTGTTAAESVRTLQRAGVRVHAVVAIGHA